MVCYFKSAKITQSVIVAPVSDSVISKAVFTLCRKIIFRSRAPKKWSANLASSITNRPLLVFCETRHLERTVFEERE